MTSPISGLSGHPGRMVRHQEKADRKSDGHGDALHILARRAANLAVSFLVAKRDEHEAKLVLLKLQRLSHLGTSCKAHLQMRRSGEIEILSLQVPWRCRCCGPRTTAEYSSMPLGGKPAGQQLRDSRNQDDWLTGRGSHEARRCTSPGALPLSAGVTSGCFSLCPPV